MKTELCDFHSHFLPGMDDGCKTPEESVALLKLSYGQGVRRIFATPHYYPVEPVSDFLGRREAAAERLQAQLENQPEAQIPQFLLGAEVAFRPGLGYEKDLEKLCLGPSRYLLLEMPFSRWTGSQIREVANICSAQGIVPVIAHIERYMHYQSADILKILMQQDVLIQMNAEYLLNWKTRRKGLKMLQKGLVHLLGTDSHNLTSRSPNLGEAVQYLYSRNAMETVWKQNSFGEDVFSG